MLKGFLCAIGACFLWGFIFVVPLTLKDFHAIELVVGRYLAYGIFSLSLLGFIRFFKGASSFREISFSDKTKAMRWGIASGMGYYSFLLIGLRYLDPAVSALIQGLSPITIACYGNWLQRDCSFRMLIAPCILIFIGLISVNIPLFESEAKEISLFDYGIGLAANLMSLSLWTWFVVTNARFLKKNSSISSIDWSILIGSGNLIAAVFLGIIAFSFFPEHLRIFSGFFSKERLLLFAVGCSVQGILSGWLGGNLWNVSSRILPVTLSGQLMILETVFGVSFIFLYQERWPEIIEFLGITCMLGGIFISLKRLAFSQKTIAHAS